MKKVVSLASLAMLIGLTGCISTQKNACPAPVLTKNVAEFEPTVTIGDKISGTATGYSLFGLFWIGPSEFAEGTRYNGGVSDVFGVIPSPANKAKSAAAYNAIKNSNADMLVAPNYLVTTKNYFVVKKITATVDARKGTIEGYTQLKHKDGLIQ